MNDAARIALHGTAGSWWANSPDVPGWTAAADSMDDLLTLIREASSFVPFGPYVLCQGWMPTRVQMTSSTGLD